MGLSIDHEQPFSDRFCEARCREVNDDGVEGLTDFTDDPEKIDVPTLILHRDADQIVPIEDSALLSSKLVRNSILEIIPAARGVRDACGQNQCQPAVFSSSVLTVVRTRRVPGCGKIQKEQSLFTTPAME